ncbi:class I SAM-dependent methyltransferase [Dactylosporangium sp. NPDC005555]|uniref:class I SAM-dependent methyltransferase n=1 Tax=Dactylosporangium sp. NPDC005555 TaxID=3154889 RepID=UPI0033BACC3F
MQTEAMTAEQADKALKSKHRVMWALGDYAAVAADVIPALGPVLAGAIGAGPGVRVLDVAAGSGNAAIPAALAGADVVATDLTPELLRIGERLAAARGATLTWETADAEALPFEAAAFDAVMSCVGVMFAPHHQAGAGELVRVCRPGGTIGLVNWTPEGFIGQMFATMKPYAPPPPPGAQPPPLWGSEAHVRDLFGDAVTDVVAQRRMLRVEAFPSAEAFLEFFKRTYGPTIAVYAANAGDPAAVAALDAALLDLARAHDLGGGAMEWQYLLYVARRA